MLVTMTAHSWHQTDNEAFITWKLVGYVAYRQWQNVGSVTIFLTKSAFLTNEKCHFGSKFFGALLLQRHHSIHVSGLFVIS